VSLDVIAHRGFAGTNPENTAGAFRAAAPDADAVELDVRLTADGDPVVFHDDRLDDLTDATGAVGATPTATVCAAEVLGSGERVPRLREAVAAVPADVGLNVELKGPGTTPIRPNESLPPGDRAAARARWTPLVDAVREDLADAPHDVLYSSFCEGALAAVRARCDAPVAPVVGADLSAGLEVAARYGASAVHPRATLVAGTPFADGVGVDVVARAADAGMAVNAWTVTTWRRAAGLRAAGVDGVIADYPGLTRW
jgi:glycerophosphoryl diester phosphodiesterase